MPGLRITCFRLVLATAIITIAAVASAASTAEPPVQHETPANRLEANKALVRAFLKALETGDITALNAIRGGEGETHSPNGESRRATTSANLGERCPMCAALPDRKISIDMVMAEGDLVAVRSIWTGTYTGTYRGMVLAAPTPVTVRYVNIYRIANGRIVENWASYDRLHLAEQLGYALNPADDRVKPAPPAQQAAVANAASATDTGVLVGTWRLVEFEDLENGKTVHRFGKQPSGLFVYTADGRVIIHIANPANPNCLAPSKKSGPGRIDDTPLPACSSDQMRALLDGTVAYWGTYTVDWTKGVVVHRVTSDLSNGYAGTDQPRPFRLTGNRLEIGDGKTWRRVLERVGR